jgi:hypothetical protein
MENRKRSTQWVVFCHLHGNNEHVPCEREMPHETSGYRGKIVNHSYSEPWPSHKRDSWHWQLWYEYIAMKGRHIAVCLVVKEALQWYDSSCKEPHRLPYRVFETSTAISLWTGSQWQNLDWNMYPIFFNSCLSLWEHRASAIHSLHFSFLIITQSVGLLGREINPSQPNIHARGGIRTHDHSVQASEDNSCSATVTGHVPHYVL